MSQTIEFQSRVGKDGTLDLHVPVGDMAPGTEVLVTIRKMTDTAKSPAMDRAQWHQFVEQTYGSCAGLDLDRAPQGEFEKREAIE